MTSSILASLPPGFRFHPTDEELMHYLQNKVSPSLSSHASIITEIDLNKLDPWQLPDKAYFGRSEWFCFSPREKKYPKGVRPNRTAASGYWKATGTDRPILSSHASQYLGVKKSLIFYKGRAPKGTKTNWMMHEYRLPCSKHLPVELNGSVRLDDWVLCRIRHKGIGTELKQETAYTNSSEMHAFLILRHMKNQSMIQKITGFHVEIIATPRSGLMTVRFRLKMLLRKK